MTGRIIDRLSLSLLGTAAAYLFFLNAGFGIVASGALAMLCACLVRFLLAHRPHRRRCTAAQARAAVQAIACMSDAEADAAIRRLLEADGAREAGDSCAVRTVVVVRHPRAQLTSSDVFSAWRNNRDCPALRVAATCPAGPQALRMAAELADPAVAIADSRCLARIVRRTGHGVPPDAPRRPASQRLRRILRAIAARRASPRMLANGLGLLAIYLAFGNDLYLFAAMLVLFVTGWLWIRNGVRRAGVVE